MMRSMMRRVMWIASLELQQLNIGLRPSFSYQFVSFYLFFRINVLSLL